MPFLALVHLRELRCAQCKELLAAAGARSFLVDTRGNALSFDEQHEPAEMTASIWCSRGHESVLLVPGDVAAEEVLITPEDAPIGRDAIVRAHVP